jgi:hypothetical protein
MDSQVRPLTSISIINLQATLLLLPYNVRIHTALTVKVMVIIRTRTRTRSQLRNARKKVRLLIYKL